MERTVRGFTWNNEAVESAGIRVAAAPLGVELSTRAEVQLLAFEQLLRERAVPLGLISQADSNRIRERHILDSLRAVPLLEGMARAKVVDLGSGAGLPGVPLAIVLPESSFVLAESRSKRAGFLE